MKFDKDPPTEKVKGDFPVLNDILTVTNCWYYLSLLERFVEFTQSLEEEVLKMYLVRAEYRYFKWIATDKVKIIRKAENAVPPLDVAFFWQAHLLSPVRYEEDTKRTAMYNPIKIPLQRIHEMQGEQPTNVILSIWDQVMKNNEPYNLTVEELLKEDGFARVTCIVCFNEIQSPWKEYTEWRTDHSVALQCHCCDAMFTVKHVGKANLFADNNDRVHKTAGLLTSYTGNNIRADSAQLLLLPVKETKALPFNQGPKVSLTNYFNQKRGDNPSTNEVIFRKKFIDAIQSTYLCTPYRASSIDLIQAVARQYKFAYKATQVINWDMPQGIVNGIRNYSKFLAVIKENPTLTAVPTFEIDLAWHTHMLHHTHYRGFTTNFVGKMVNHDDTIPEAQLEKFVKDTNSAWKKRSQRQREAIAPPAPPVYVKEEPPAAKPEVPITPIEAKRKSSSKFRMFKSFFSSSNKNSSSNVQQKASVLSTSRALIPSLLPKNGYQTERALFKYQYSEGSYKSTPPYNAVFEETRSDEENEGAASDLDEVGYDKENISFHDKRDIKDFIKLNNDDALMDQSFASVKRSVYGHIGTSACANTDYLDQWDKDPETGKAKPISPIELLKIGTDVSRYSKVFLTKGPKSRYTRAVGQIPLEERTGYKKYHPYYESQNVRYNTAGDSFNWYLVSMAWYSTQPPVSNTVNSGSCGGWSNCGNSKNGISCGGVTSNCGTASSCGRSSSITHHHSSSGGHSSCGSSSHHTSSCGGGSSSCGGGSSSCGGGSSSCGGGSSSCGGGGC